MSEDKKPTKQKRRSVSAARLYWAITDACERYELELTGIDSGGEYSATIVSLLDALKDDNMEAAR